MTQPQPNAPQQAQQTRTQRKASAAIERPSGWPVASFRSYADAQAAVDGLSDRQFPVEALTIVGVDLMQKEKVTGRLTWPRVLGGGALTGLWLGLFVGLLFVILGNPFWSIVSSLLIGLIFGVVFAAVTYGFTGGQRDFSSTTAIVAGRYDILCEPSHAPAARDAIASMGLGTAGNVDATRSTETPAQHEAPVLHEEPVQHEAQVEHGAPAAHDASATHGAPSQTHSRYEAPAEPETPTHYEAPAQNETPAQPEAPENNYYPRENN